MNNISFRVWLDGPFDLPAFDRAVAEFGRRHDALRASVAIGADGPGHVTDGDSLLLETHSCDTATDALAHSDTVIRRPFDLARSPLARIVVSRVAAQRHLLTFVAHHVVCDGSSLTVVMTELSALYSRHAGIQQAGLDRPAPSYLADAPAEVLAEDLRWWQEELAGVRPLELPTDRPRSGERTLSADSLPIKLSAELSAGIRTLARQATATPFVVLLAAFHAVLHRFTGQSDLVVGAPHSGRHRANRDVIGMYAAMLPYRSRWENDQTFLEFLTATRTKVREVSRHRRAPLGSLIEQLGLGADLSRNPVFQAALLFQNFPVPLDALPGVTMNPVGVPTLGTRYDVELELWDGKAFEGKLIFASDLYDSASARHIADAFVALLEHAVQAPGTPFAELAIMPAASPATGSDGGRAEAPVLEGFTGGGVPGPTVDFATVDEMFRHWVAIAPEAIACRDADGELTYRQLDAWVGAVAARLHAAGCRTGDVVPVSTERDAGLLAALLGVMRAGATYVPIDARAPLARNEMVLQEIGSRLVVVGSPSAPQTAGHEMIAVADCRQEQSAEPSVPPYEPASTAYVIFTSGSTGRPKGVRVGHGALVHTMAAVQQIVGLRPGEAFLALTTPSFDIAALELFLPLCHGAVVEVASAEVAQDSSAIAARLDRPGLAMAQATPTMWRAIVEAGWRGEQALHVLCGGEELSADLAARLRERAGRLWNMYGPTETTIWSTYAELTRPPGASGTGVPIGRPLAGERVYVVDERGRPVAPGMIGELWIGGAAVAEGYLDRPELTADRFRPDPFTGTGRVYRTGDLAQFAHDGTLRFHGRQDAQVKLRGHRIELGEVEAILVGHPQVSQAAATVREDHPGDRRLVAYVRGDVGIDPTAIRRHAAHLLPDYMVPAAVVVLDQMPLTANGKLDRRSLPAPDYTRTAPSAAPRTHLESVLCGLYEQILGIDEVGIDDDFFALGGHSLLAMQLTNALRDELGVDTALRTVFEAPTVAALAERLTDDPADRPALVAAPRAARTGLSYAQQRLWFLHQLDGPTAVYNIPVALHLRGAVDQDALEAALLDVVARHESLRTVVTEADGECYQTVLQSPAATAFFSRHVVAEEDLADHLDRAASYLFDLSADLPLRAWLFEIRPDHQVLALVMHHIAGDGRSMAILGRDLSTAYTARRQKVAPHWPELPVRYADYTRWQHALLKGEDGSGGVEAAQLAYWTAALADLPQSLALPHARRDSAEPARHGAAIALGVEPEIRHRLTRLAEACGVTEFMVLQATVAVLLAKLGAGTDIPLGTPVAGRATSAVNDLVGLFVNTLVLRTDVSGNPTPRELLGRIRQVDLAAFAHQDLPFERLVEVLAPKRSSSQQPLFQVMVSFDNNESVSVTFPGVSVETAELPLPISKFDLQFAFREGSTGATSSLVGSLKYSTDLFDRESAEVMAEQFHEVLDALTTEADRPLSELATSITPAERAAGGVSSEPVDVESAPYLAPRSVLERVIADAWAEVLGRDRVGVFDNFFDDLGGHSLMVTRVAGRLRGRLAAPVPVRMIFAHQTTADLAAELERRGNSAQEPQTRIPALPRPASGEYLLPTSSGQQQLWFLSQLDPAGGAAYILPAAFRVEGPLVIPAMEQAITLVINRHEVLRTRFVDTDAGEVRAVPTPQAPHPLPVVNLVGAGEATVNRLVQAEGRRPFDLSRGPLLRTRLLRLGDDAHLLLITTHHVVADGWSLSIFTHELAAAYTAIVNQTEPALGALPIQFADFAAWQHERLHGEELQPQLSYWRRQLTGVTPSQLPTDQPRPARMSFAGDTTVFDVEPGLVARLEALGRQEDATLFMVCLAAFCSVLRSWSGQDDIVVGAPVAGRTRPEVESLIGYFSSTIALRSDLSGAPSFRELLGRTRQVCLDGYAHQEVPFERLVQALRPPRDPGRSPVYQVMFALQNAPKELLQLGQGVTLTRLRTTRTSSFLDLAFLLAEDGAGGLRGSVEYNTDLFDKSTMQRLATQVCALLEAVAADPDQALPAVDVVAGRN